MLIAGSAPSLTKLTSQASLVSTVEWTISEKQPNGTYKPVHRGKNLQTNYGLTQFASALGGLYTPPLWLVIDDGWTTQTSLSYPSLVVPSPIHKAGDTNLILGLGLATQDSVPFSGASGAGPTTYTLTSTPAHSHSNGEKVTRDVRAADTLASVNHELQYDSTLFPGQRTVAAGSGFSSGTGNYTMQFFLTGTEAVTTFAHLGLADNVNVGSGNLHNFLVSGYTHASSKDLQIDVSITLANA